MIHQLRNRNSVICGPLPTLGPSPDRTIAENANASIRPLAFAVYKASWRGLDHGRGSVNRQPQESHKRGVGGSNAQANHHAA
jgi:hypothetical protein